MTETVNHPRHYNAHLSGVECITVVEHMSFNVGNAIEDLRKAAWYVQREIDRRVALTPNVAIKPPVLRSA